MRMFARKWYCAAKVNWGSGLAVTCSGYLVFTEPWKCPVTQGSRILCQQDYYSGTSSVTLLSAALSGFPSHASCSWAFRVFIEVPQMVRIAPMAAGRKACRVAKKGSLCTVSHIVFGVPQLSLFVRDGLRLVGGRHPTSLEVVPSDESSRHTTRPSTCAK